MKKAYLTLLFVCTLVWSCSTEDNSQAQNNLIIGTWGMYLMEYEGENNGYEEKNPNLEENQISFKSDGTIGKFQGQAIEGTWENMGNGIYKFVTPQGTENITIDFPSEEEMVINHQEHEADHYRKIE